MIVFAFDSGSTVSPFDPYFAFELVSEARGLCFLGGFLLGGSFNFFPVKKIMPFRYCFELDT